MTVTAQDLADYSPFQVSDSLAGPVYISSATFAKFAALAKIKLDRDAPGLATEEYDHGHALLIAHLIAARSGTLEKTSESLDNYRYEKSAGASSFLVQYETLITEATNSATKPTQLIAHSDTYLGNLKFDQAELPLLFDKDDVDGEPEDP